MKKLIFISLVFIPMLLAFACSVPPPIVATDNNFEHTFLNSVRGKMAEIIDNDPSNNRLFLFCGDGKSVSEFGEGNITITYYFERATSATEATYKYLPFDTTTEYEDATLEVNGGQFIVTRHDEDFDIGNLTLNNSDWNINNGNISDNGDNNEVTVNFLDSVRGRHTGTKGSGNVGDNGFFFCGDGKSVSKRGLSETITYYFERATSATEAIYRYIPQGQTEYVDATLEVNGGNLTITTSEAIIGPEALRVNSDWRVNDGDI